MLTYETDTLSKSDCYKVARFVESEIGVEYEVNIDGLEGNVVIFDLTSKEMQKIVTFIELL